MTFFFIGVFTGLLAMWLLYTGKRKRLKLIEEDKQRLQQEKQIVVEFMHNMVEAVAEESNRAAMFQRIIHAAILSTGAMSACIFEKCDNDTLKGIALEGLFPPQRKLPNAMSSKFATRTQYLENILKSETFKMGEGLIGQVAKSHRAQLIADARSDPRVIQHDDPALEVRSLIIAPILFRDQLIAVLAVANPADELAFTDTDFSLVESLAEQVGLAVHNGDAIQIQIDKNKLDIDIELASNIQSLLLPSTFPASDYVEFAAHYTAAQKIGGDLYDVFSIDEDRIGIAIADVSGKGIAASLLMAICQTNLRHFSRQKDSPSEVLRAINAQMGDSMRRDMFITIVYAIIDLKSDQITFARAGHELPFLYHRLADGTRGVESIKSEGMALGMVPPEIFDFTIKDKTVPFTQGDALLLYTDGVTESINASGSEYSGERLTDHFKAKAEANAQSILDHVLDSVHRHSGNEGQVDDLTLIVVKHR
jgi:sigma-B regulation protein RsbU (phosphoserine phosphatase)